MVVASPATTWAFVITRPGAMTKPLPSWIRWQASPMTLTVERVTRVDTASEMPLAGGGVPTAGVGRSASNTCG